MSRGGTNSAATTPLNVTGSSSSFETRFTR